jgi:hypothetical protein
MARTIAKGTRNEEPLAEGATSVAPHMAAAANRATNGGGIRRSRKDTGRLWIVRSTEGQARG